MGCGKMSNMEFLDTLEAEKFKKQKWLMFCGTPCKPTFFGSKFPLLHSGTTWKWESFMCSLKSFCVLSLSSQKLHLKLGSDFLNASLWRNQQLSPKKLFCVLLLLIRFRNFYHKNGNNMSFQDLHTILFKFDQLS